jgi:hypothetical protein
MIEVNRRGIFTMEAILAEWGAEIILSLVIAMLTYYFKKDAKEKDAERKHYE